MSFDLKKRFAEAYLNMAEKARYRPAAPSDGVGNIDPDYDTTNKELLRKEATEYAEEFFKQESSGDFYIGVSNYKTNRELVYVIEAAGLLCSGRDKTAARLLTLALSTLPAPDDDAR